MTDYMVLGFDANAENVIFFKDNEWIYIKHTLPKNMLVAYLDIPSSSVNKYLRDEILENAREQGRLCVVYSLDNEHYQIDSSFFYDNKYRDYKFRKLINIEDRAKYPYKLSPHLLKEIIENSDKKIKQDVIKDKNDKIMSIND